VKKKAGKAVEKCTANKKGVAVKPSLEGYYSISEAAKYLGKRSNSVWHQAKNGNLKTVSVSGRLFVKESVLKSFVMPKQGNPNIGKDVRAAFSALKSKRKASAGKKKPSPAKAVEPVVSQ
jgi:hypothetical protein